LTALDLYGRGIDLLTAQRLPLEVGEAQVAYASALRRFDRPEEAFTQLQAARATFDAVGAIGLVDRIDAMLVGATSGAG
jgi:hypothetical protein